MRLSEEALQRALAQGHVRIASSFGGHPLLDRIDPPLEHAPERDFQAKVRQLARETGWEYYHTYNSRRSDEGFPDTVLARPGDRVIFAELKKGAQEKLSQKQKSWLSILWLCPGVEAYHWIPSDWPFILARLQQPCPSSPGILPPLEDFHTACLQALKARLGVDVCPGEVTA